MKHKNQLRLISLALILIIGLSACGSLPFANATPTQDIAAVQTSAAATAFVQLTAIAESVMATDSAKPTATELPTSTPTSMPTALEQITTTALPSGASLPATATIAAGGVLPLATLPVGGPTPTVGVSIVVPSNATPVKPCYNSLFITDVTIPDNTVLKRLERFTKIWKIQNAGTCNWDEGFGLVYFNGEKLSGVPVYFSGRDPLITPGMQVDMPISMIAPDKKGTYYSEWIMVDDSGKSFGYPFYVMIEVK
jgi:hypothetical protein